MLPFHRRLARSGSPRSPNSGSSSRAAMPFRRTGWAIVRPRMLTSSRIAPTLMGSRLRWIAFATPTRRRVYTSKTSESGPPSQTSTSPTHRPVRPQSGPFSRDVVLALADQFEATPLERHTLATRFREAGRHNERAFARYRVDADQRTRILASFSDWANDIDPATDSPHP